MKIHKEKTFIISANLFSLTWDRKASTLPDTCRVRTKVTISGKYNSIPDIIIHEAIRKDIQKRYNVYPQEYNIFDLKVEIV